MFRQSFILVGLSAIVDALNAPLPLPTDNIANAMGFGFDPIPTAAPMLPPNLFKRQATGSGSLIGYLAPDNTCGYVSGALGMLKVMISKQQYTNICLASIKTCDTTQSCAAVVVSGVASMGCCDSTAGTCQFLGNCVGSVGYYASSLCGPACQADLNTLKW
jgi:hypothetical protein